MSKIPIIIPAKYEEKNIANWALFMIWLSKTQELFSFSPAHLLDNCSNMSTDHKLLFLSSPMYKIGRSMEVYLYLMDVNISRLQCVFSWSGDSG